MKSYKVVLENPMTTNFCEEKLLKDAIRSGPCFTVLSGCRETHNAVSEVHQVKVWGLLHCH